MLKDVFEAAFEAAFEASFVAEFDAAYEAAFEAAFDSNLRRIQKMNNLKRHHFHLVDWHCLQTVTFNI